jgi:hypothetical protein
MRMFEEKEWVHVTASLVPSSPLVPPCLRDDNNNNNVHDLEQNILR